jgi:hypothetical protein
LRHHILFSCVMHSAACRKGLMCLYLVIASVYFALTTYGPVVCRLVFRAEGRARAPESVIAVNIFYYPWPFPYHRSRQPSIRSLSTALRLDALQNLHLTQVPNAHAKEVEQVFKAISHCSSTVLWYVNVTKP